MRRPLMLVAGALAVVLAVATAAVAVVDDDRQVARPGYAMHQMMRGNGAAGGPDRAQDPRYPMHGAALTTEFAYLAEMVAHHEEAVAAAIELRRSDRPRMRALGQAIVASQTAQIDQMKTWLAEWYPDRSTDVDYQPMMRDLTGLSGDRLDRVFLEDMIPHHMMAVMMSQQLLMRGTAEHGQVATLATSIRDEQHAELFWMQRRLATWFDADWRHGMGPGMGAGSGPGMGSGSGPGMGSGSGPGMGSGSGPGSGAGSGRGMGPAAAPGWVPPRASGWVPEWVGDPFPGDGPESHCGQEGRAMFDVRRKTLVATAVAAVTAGSVLVPPAPVNARDHGHMDDGYARLHSAKGFPKARGPVAYHSEYDSHHSGMDEEFHLVLRGVKKLAGKRVRVFVHGDLVGRARVNDNGRARLHRHGGVGGMHDGWGIRVRTGSGRLVAHARLDGHMDDSPH